KDTKAGGPTLNATGGGLTPGNQLQTVNPGAPTVLGFASAAQTVQVGVCSSLATVQTRDGFGNASTVAAATTVNFASSSPLGTFYSDAACTNAVSAMAVAAGASSTGLYFKDTRASTATLTASAA